MAQIMRRLIVFFSWQSDIPQNHSKIKNGLEKACKRLSKELCCEVVYDESTRGEPGSPKIDDAVEKKIDLCDVFVADATPVTEHHGRLCPNSNVMYELGRARAIHACQRIVTLAAKGDWEIKNLPFDINHTVIPPVDIDNIDGFYHLIKSSVKFAYDSPETIFLHDDRVLYSDYQIQKNINSGKYLPNTFLEKRNLKEHLRYFADPYLFSSYIADKIYRFNFHRLNRGKKIWNKHRFNFNAKQFQIDSSASSFIKLYESVLRLKDYLANKTDELYHGSNESYLNSSKCRRRLEDLSFLTSQICLLTGNAGQGKTNFICDFVQNVLLKRHIPFIYVNGYEIDSVDIERTLVKAICPTLDISFEKLMEQLTLYSSSKRKPVIFVIDGLNENPHPDDFCRMLVAFLKRLLAYDFCKVIMTCRSEYLEENFQELTETFKNKMMVEKNIYHHLNEDDIDTLLKRYFKYFNITAHLDEAVKSILTENLLLLRIFCEANKYRRLGRVNHINRDELFTVYYDTMLTRVADAPDWEGRRDFRRRKIKGFFTVILKRMIEADKFFNVSLDDLLEDMNQEDENMLLRFLDENILLRKDLAKDKEMAENDEVVNFTYDAFRDYMLAHYILNMPRDNFEQQKKIIKKFTDDGHQLKEGIIPYLFVHAKNTASEELWDFLKGCPWYVSAFESYVWETDESKVSDEDIGLLLQLLNENPYNIARNLLYWGRWNTEVHPKLNIKILLEYVSKLEDGTLEKWVEKICCSTNKKYYWGHEGQTERERFIEMVRSLLGNSQFFEYKDSELVFEFYAYVASVSDVKAKEVYRQYIRQTSNIEQVQHIFHTTKSENLKAWMNQLITLL